MKECQIYSSSASVVKTIHKPSSPALTMTEPFSPSDAPRTGARWPVWVRSSVPLRLSHVRRVLSADAEIRRYDFGVGCARRVVIASCCMKVKLVSRRR